MRKMQIVGLTVLMTAGAASAAESLRTDGLPASVRPAAELLVAQRRSCQAVSTCREAVIMWCEGYSRADGDGDGVPCENVCGSRSQVQAIQKEIGC
ncbi:MAG TPA: excalibur calcium-binding domain-containing protein [Microvirga sp.]|nr:excalibur calcium-binding domain-containing protein [Microvirga sp.]